MSGYICRTCRLSIRRALRAPLLQSKPPARALNTDGFFELDDNRAMDTAPETHPRNPSQRENHGKAPPIDIDALLSKPTWSVRSLLPTKNDRVQREITHSKLYHLLRLSALPKPSGTKAGRKLAERKMLETLDSQLHFVRDIQKVNTDGVDPLRAIRDETEEGIKEITIGMEALKDAFAKEDVVGKNRRPRRRRGGVVDGRGVEDWDVLGCADEVVEMNGGRYFVVRSGNRGRRENQQEKEVRKKATKARFVMTDLTPGKFVARSIPLDENGVEIETSPEDTELHENVADMESSPNDTELAAENVTSVSEQESKS